VLLAAFPASITAAASCAHALAVLRELIRYTSVVEDRRAGRHELSLTRADTEYVDKVTKRVNRGDDLFSQVPSVYFFTYVDKDGFVPKEVS
jgi:hypothetical protein